MQETAKDDQNSITTASVPKKALRQPPAIQIPDPVTVGHARVALVIEKILPLETSGGPCDKSPCRATAQVKQVHGVGSSFTSALADGQLIEVYFPMTMAGLEGSASLIAGDVLVAELQQPLVGSTVFIVSKFNRQQ